MMATSPSYSQSNAVLIMLLLKDRAKKLAWTETGYCITRQVSIVRQNAFCLVLAQRKDFVKTFGTTGR